MVNLDWAALGKRSIASVRLDPAWVRRAIGLIETKVGRLSYFRGSYRMAPQSSEWFTFYLTSAWLDGLDKSWSNTVESKAWFEGESAHIDLFLDHHRSIVELEVKTPSLPSSAQILDDLANQLAVRVIATDPYRYRRSAAVFRIRRWSRDEFANATDLAVRGMTAEGPPAVREAYVTEMLPDGTERLHGFFDLESFLARVRDPSVNVAAIALSIDGIGGRGFGIGVNDEHTRLQIRTSEPAEKLADLVSPYLEPLSLKQEKLDGGGPSPEVPPKPEKWWVQHAVALLIALLGSGALLTVAKSWYTDYTLLITEPQQFNGIVERTSAEVDLDWDLRPTDAFLRGVDHHAAASVVVFEDGKPARLLGSLTPPARVSLGGVGTFRIKIQPTKKSAAGVLVVRVLPAGTVLPLPSPQPPVPAATPTPK